MPVTVADDRGPFEVLYGPRPSPVNVVGAEPYGLMKGLRMADAALPVVVSAPQR